MTTDDSKDGVRLRGPRPMNTYLKTKIPDWLRDELGALVAWRSEAIGSEVRLAEVVREALQVGLVQMQIQIEDYSKDRVAKGEKPIIVPGFDPRGAVLKNGSGA